MNKWDWRLYVVAVPECVLERVEIKVVRERLACDLGSVWPLEFTKRRKRQLIIVSIN
jgi:hypothetical protein